MADISLEAVAKALNLDASELEKLTKNGDAELPKPELEAAVTAKLKTHLTDTLATVKTGAFDEGHGKATREVLSAKERALRSKYPNIEGKDLDEIFENAVKGTGSTDWTKNPQAAAALQEREAKIAEKDAEIQKLQSQYKKELTTVKLSNKLPAMLDELGFQVPTDAKRQKKLMGVFLDALMPANVEIREADGDDDFIPWDIEKNTQVKTSDYKPVGFKDWVKGAAEEIFDPKTPGAHRSPGNKEGESKPGGTDAGGVELTNLTTWPAIYEYKKGIRATDKDAPEKFKALDAHIAALKKAGTLKDS